MIAGDLKRELFEILGFIPCEEVFRKLTDSMRKLQKQSATSSAEVILIQSWQDELYLKDKRSLLYMVRAQELYRNNFFDEAQKYESLAVQHY